MTFSSDPDSKCPVCSSSRSVCFNATVLRRYDVPYLFCSVCGLLQASTPFWLQEAYQSAIADADTGLLYRNYRFVRRIAPLLYWLNSPTSRFLDVAGGYGVFTRLMRDVGFNFFWSDPYCENLFARGFGREQAEPPFAAVTALEVLEHVPDPLQFIRAALSESECSTFIFSTVLFQGQPPPVDWWYYVFNTGQHISFYRLETLQMIAESLSLYLYSARDLHMLSKRKISWLTYSAMTGRFSSLSFAYVRRKMRSRMMTDHEEILRSGNRTLSTDEVKSFG